jgi:S-(hydroxymethyl)glutathione dehydrogenase/alcohol dehydrogenase
MSEQVPRETNQDRRLVSRRGVLTAGAAAGAIGLLAKAKADATQQGAAGRRFRAWVNRGSKPGSIQELELLPIGERQLVVRTEATSCCYTLVREVLGAAVPDSRHPERATIVGHGGVGVVEAVGPGVRRAKVGDRVIVAVGPQCGVCRPCIRGRPDFCLAFFEPGVPVAQMEDGTQVYQTSNIGGNAELMVPYEDWVYPVATNRAPVELCVLSCSGTVGLATSTAFVPVEPGSNVVILGAGLLGLSAVQGARIMGAGQIIVVDPIRARREAALKLGATTVLDPNEEKDRLVEHIRNLCPPLSDRTFDGGGPLLATAGADIVIEAVGGDRFPPKAEQGPDPTGVTSLRQAWEICVPTGHYVTLGAGQTGALTFDNPGMWAVFNKTHHPSTFGGAWPLRDIPRFVKFIERGQFNAKALVSSSYPLDQLPTAYQRTADRIGISAAITFT